MRVWQGSNSADGMNEKGWQCYIDGKATMVEEITKQALAAERCQRSA